MKHKEQLRMEANQSKNQVTEIVDREDQITQLRDEIKAKTDEIGQIDEKLRVKEEMHAEAEH